MELIIILINIFVTDHHILYKNLYIYEILVCDDDYWWLIRAVYIYICLLFHGLDELELMRSDCKLHSVLLQFDHFCYGFVKMENWPCVCSCLEEELKKAGNIWKFVFHVLLISSVFSLV